MEQGYSISWKEWRNLDECRKWMDIRRANLKHTTIMWVTVGMEIDPDMIDGVYYRKSPILLWLN